MCLLLASLGLQLFLILLYFPSVLTACPNGLQGDCECSEGKEGFFIDCKGINNDLNTVLAPIEKIHIERLKINGAYWPILKRLPKLSVKSIQLINCGIEDVERETFKSVTEHLEELVLANNSLSIVPDLGSLHKLVSLNLKHNKIKDVSDTPFKNMSNLAQLRLDDNEIRFLPSTFLKDVKNTLELLDLSGNRLERVPAKNLKNLPRLMYLDLSENRITAIDDFDFSDLPQLKELRLNDNQLKEIATLAFKDVPRLKHMLLQNNFLTEFDTSAMIEGFRKLEVLDMSNNRLLEVPILKELPNIIQVRLENNMINRINSYTFSGNHRLRHLSLQNNKISAIAPNSFSRLLGLTHLLLGNNGLRFIERDVFRGMDNLEQLSLQNNSLNELEDYTFIGIPSLKMLDLSYNGLHRIAKNAFKPLQRVMWIDLSHNVITTVEKGTFEDPIPNIILFGNPIRCDEKVEWLVNYLIVNRVRIHLPFQSEVMCAAPEKYTSVRLRDFLTRKTNETISAMTGVFRIATGRTSGSDMMSNLLPASMRKFIPSLDRAEKNPYSNVPVVGAITKALPGLRNLPGLNYIPQATGARAENVQSLNKAIEKFSSPLIRVATGESESLSEIDQMVKAIPEMAANLPGMKELDLSKLPPNVMLHVLRGGQIAGIEKETWDKIIKEHTQKMYDAALASKNGHPLVDEARYLPPVDKFPKELIAEMMKGVTLPHLTTEQSSVIKGYYMRKVAGALSSGTHISLPDEVITPQLKSMIKMMPPNYDVNKIPLEVLESVAEGRIPDLDALPADLRDYLLNGPHGGAGKEPSVDDVLRKLPNAEATVTPSYERYDINKVSVDLIKAEEEAARKERLRFYSSVLLCVVAVLSTVVLILLFLYMRRRKAMIADKKLDSFYSAITTRQQHYAHVLLPNQQQRNVTSSADRSRVVHRSESRPQRTYGQYDVSSPAS